jgi:hypothetical protein
MKSFLGCSRLSVVVPDDLGAFIADEENCSKETEDKELR